MKSLNRKRERSLAELIILINQIYAANVSTLNPTEILNLINEKVFKLKMRFEKNY